MFTSLYTRQLSVAYSLSYGRHVFVTLDGGAENTGVENAGVEKAGAITYGKPSEQKTLKIPGV